MEDALRWLVTFSSPYHLFWFMLSTGWLAVTLGWRRPWQAKYALIGHAVTAVDAALAILFGVGGPVYSVHCIWFNGLMAVLHWRLLERFMRDNETGSP